MNQELIIDILGWIGVAALLLAYGLLSLGKLAGHGAIYQALNVVGSGLLIINSYYYRAMPSVAVNVFWILIGLVSLGRVWFGRRAQEVDL